MALKLKRFDAAKYIETPEDEIETLRSALHSGEAGYIAAALGAVARARGIAELAEKTGLNRTALYDALSLDGNPRLDTFLKVLAALEIELNPARAEHAERAMEPA
jgi:probable addiction module antidote protein